MIGYLWIMFCLFKYLPLLSLVFLISCDSYPKEDGGEVFRYNEASGIASLDPIYSRDQASNWISKQIFSTLVDTDSSLNILPNLAESWTVDNQGLVYNFSLRSDVFFHNSPCFSNGSKKMTSKDVVYSLTRLKNPSLGSPGAWVLENVNFIKSDGLFNVLISLHKPDPSFLGKLSIPYCGIVPIEAIEYYENEFSFKPVGSGPFFLKAWRLKDKLVLRRNRRFYQKDLEGNSLPYLEAVSVRFIPDRQAAFLEFIKGNLDFLTGVDASYKDQLFTKDGFLKEYWSKKYKLYRTPFLNTEYIGIRSTDPNPSYLSDSRVRRALNLSIDRNSMIKYLKNGIGKSAYGGIIPIGLMGHKEKAAWKNPYLFQKDSAIGLLKASGILKNSTEGSLDPIILSTTSSYRDLCEYIQNAWEEIGIPVQIDVLPAAVFREDKSNGRLPVYRASWIADYPDSENYLMLFESKMSAPNGPNSSLFKDSAYDDLVRKGKDVSSDSLRGYYFMQADQKLHDESRLIPLIYDESIRVLPKEWLGLSSHPMNWLDLRKVKKEKG